MGCAAAPGPQRLLPHQPRRRPRGLQPLLPSAGVAQLVMTELAAAVGSISDDRTSSNSSARARVCVCVGGCTCQVARFGSVVVRLLGYVSSYVTVVTCGYGLRPPPDKCEQLSIPGCVLCPRCFQHSCRGRKGGGWALGDCTFLTYIGLRLGGRALAQFQTCPVWTVAESVVPQCAALASRRGCPGCARSVCLLSLERGSF